MVLLQTQPVAMDVENNNNNIEKSKAMENIEKPKEKINLKKKEVDEEEEEDVEQEQTPIPTPEEPRRETAASVASAAGSSKVEESAAVVQSDSPNNSDSEDSWLSCSSSSAPSDSESNASGSDDNIETEDAEQQVARILQQQNDKKEKVQYVKRGVHTHMATVIAAVVVIKDGKLLMMQEAKSSKRGKWYIPAGRVEPGESPLEGAIREVKEETGLDLNPTGVFSIEFKPKKRRNWVRYGITGEITGGSLKHWEDEESIDSAWIEIDKIRSLELRNTDFLRMVDTYLGCNYLSSNNSTLPSSASTTTTPTTTHTPTLIPMVYSLNAESQREFETERAAAKTSQKQQLQFQQRHEGWLD